uniref:Putative type III restriction enzyme n=1 Tax=viral metagenome TaxID=1070528 RepID=A0A6M3KAQ6_9ZZZZ
MKIIVSDKVYLHKAPDNIKSLIKKTLTLPNPVYQVMLRKGNMKALYAVKKDFKYYTEVGDWMSIGRGCFDAVVKLCRKNYLPFDIEERLCSKNILTDFKSNGLILRDYQEGVAEEILKKKNGIIKLSVGFGKTLLALRLAEIARKRTLIVVPRKLILDQFKEELKKYYNYEPGIIQGNKFEVKDITLASISTLSKRNLDKIKNKFGMIIADECHQFITEARMRTIQSFNPSRLYGMSGTPLRDDGQSEAIKFLFGDILIDRELPQAVPTVHRIKTNISIEVSYDYHEMIDEMVNNEKRNIIIKEIAQQEVKEKRKVLILCKRIAHGKTIKDLIDKKIKVFQLDSTIKDKEELFRKFRKDNNKFDILIGTFSLLSTGINLEILSSLIIAGDLKSKLLSTQSAGRCLRTMLNKPNVNIWDLVDNENGILYRHSLNRRKLYLEKGWKIVDK